MILLTNQVCQGDLGAKSLLLEQLDTVDKDPGASEVLQATATACRERLLSEGGADF